MGGREVKRSGRCKRACSPRPPGLSPRWGPDRYQLGAIKLSPCHLCRIQSRMEGGREGRGRGREGERGREVKSCSASQTNFLTPLLLLHPSTPSAPAPYIYYLLFHSPPPSPPLSPSFHRPRPKKYPPNPLHTHTRTHTLPTMSTL